MFNSVDYSFYKEKINSAKCGWVVVERKYNRAILPFARDLRKNMTSEENHLWYDFLRNYLVKFTRQKILGKYIADFYCTKAFTFFAIALVGGAFPK